jgi:hypothetical protein
VIIVRNANGSGGTAVASHWWTINNGTRTEIGVVNSGWDMWGASIFRVNLGEGVNTLAVTKGANFAEIDEIDVFLDG